MDNELNFKNFLEKSVIQGGKRLNNGSVNSSKPLFSIITVVYNNEKFIFCSPHRSRRGYVC